VNREVQAFLRRIVSLDWDVDSLAAEAARLLICTGKRKGPEKALPGESRKAKRERKRTTHRERTAQIREERMAIALGQCEGSSHVMRCQRLATQMHHLAGGSGRRRQQQSVETVRMLCEYHHREAHREARREKRHA
jgi:hypothetical protein